MFIHWRPNHPPAYPAYVYTRTATRCKVQNQRFFFFLNLQFRAKRSFLGLKTGERRFSTETLAKAAIYLNKKYLHHHLKIDTTA